MFVRCQIKHSLSQYDPAQGPTWLLPVNCIFPEIPGDTQSLAVPYPNVFVDWISMNRKSSLLEGLGVKVGIYCARRLIKHLEVFAKQL